MRSGWRRALAGGTLLACLVALPACGGDDDDHEPKPRAAKFEPGKCPTKKITPEVQKVLEQARCGVLVVPENRGKSNSRSIRNGVAIIPAKSSTPAPDPIVYVHGGPGSSAVSEAGELVEAAELNADRDLILMSQRGNLHSQPELTCLAIDRFNARARWRSASTVTRRKRLRAQATRTCRRELAAKADLAAYNTTESAADLDDLRKALGIRDWNAFGHSYGTQLAQTYVRKYPQHIRAVVLDGLVPADIASYGLLWRATGEAFRNISRACEDEPRCRERYGDIGERFNRLLSEAAKKPIKTEVRPEGGGKPVEVVLDPTALISWLIPASHLVADAPAAIAEAADGRPQKIAEQYGLSKVNPEGFGNFSWGLLNSVTCAEWNRGVGEVSKEGRRAFPGLPASFQAKPPQVPFSGDDCGVWDVPKAPDSLRDPLSNDIPTLIVNGSFDAQTAQSAGAHVARTLPNSTVITIPGAAHGTFFESKCSASAITSFFNHPNVPDTSCVQDAELPKFN